MVLLWYMFEYHYGMYLYYLTSVRHKSMYWSGAYFIHTSKPVEALKSLFVTSQNFSPSHPELKYFLQDWSGELTYINTSMAEIGRSILSHIIQFLWWSRRNLCLILCFLILTMTWNVFVGEQGNAVCSPHCSYLPTCRTKKTSGFGGLRCKIQDRRTPQGISTCRAPC